MIRETLQKNRGVNKIKQFLTQLAQLKFKNEVSTISNHLLDQLDICWENENSQELIIKALLFHIKKCTKSPVRVKYLYLLQIILSKELFADDLELIQQYLNRFHQQNRQQSEQMMLNASQKENEFILIIELPYVQFLKRVANWHVFDFDRQQLSQMVIQFRRFNKINEILDMKNWFKYYDSHHSDHNYVLQIYQWSLQAIFYYWNSILLKVKDINNILIEYQEIMDEQYIIFLLQAQKMQIKIYDFIQNNRFYIFIDDSLKIKQYEIITSQVKALYSFKKISEKKTLTKIGELLQKIKKNLCFSKRKDPLKQPLLRMK